MCDKLLNDIYDKIKLYDKKCEECTKPKTYGDFVCSSCSVHDILLMLESLI